MNMISSDLLFGSNLYNHLFGMNPNIKEILKLYNLNIDFDLYRVRDCYFLDDKFVLLTRIGNKVYSELQEDIKKHPNYLYYDLYDGDTYMTFYFSLIPEIKDEYFKYDNRHVQVKFETINYAEYAKSDKFDSVKKNFEKLFKNFI